MRDSQSSVAPWDHGVTHKTNGWKALVLIFRLHGTLYCINILFRYPKLHLCTYNTRSQIPFRMLHGLKSHCVRVHECTSSGQLQLRKRVRNSDVTN
jgi:hypothetical protein